MAPAHDDVGCDQFGDDRLDFLDAHRAAHRLAVLDGRFVGKDAARVAVATGAASGVSAGPRSTLSVVVVVAAARAQSGVTTVEET